MKNTFKFTTRFAATAFATGALCCAGPLFGQEEQTGAQSSPSASASSSESTTTGTSDTQSSATEKSSTTSKSSTGATAKKASGTTSGALNKQDQQFLQTAGKDGLKEVEMGKMAEQHGQSAEVKRLGKMMVTDHSQANTKLMAVAKKNGVKLDTKAPAANMPSSGNFDQQWVSEMIPAHQRAIGLFQTEAKQGSNKEITAFASTTLPTLQKHLTGLQAAQGKGGGTTESKSTTGWRRKST